MGIFADRYTFRAEPPSAELINRELSTRMGRPLTLFGIGRRGARDLIVYCELNDILHFYAMSVLIDLGGTRIDISTRVCRTTRTSCPQKRAPNATPPNVGEIHADAVLERLGLMSTMTTPAARAATPTPHAMALIGRSVFPRLTASRPA